MKKNNPFTLSFGELPKEYISRYDLQDEVVSTFAAEHPVSRTYLIEGVRGSGKTVLMTKISEEILSKGDWVVLNLNSTQDLLMDMSIRIADLSRKITDPLAGGFNLSVAGFGVWLGGQQTDQHPISIIRDSLSELQKKKKKILITIDEVEHNQSMRQFASEFQILIREGYSLFLIMTGLYDQIYAIQNDPALTFLLRSSKISLGPLNQGQMTNIYERAFETNRQTAKMLAEVTKGYAFAFQALGMLYYEYRDSLDMGEILIKLDEMLDGYVYGKIWDSLSDKDREVVLAFPEHTVKTKEMCEILSMESSIFSKYRDRLLKKGVIAAVRHGYIELALPRFKNVVEGYE